MPRPVTHWIRVYDGIHENLKVKRLARTLGINVDMAVGRLTRFWVWMSRHRPGGFIDGIDDQDLLTAWSGCDADCASCDRPPCECGRRFREAMVDAGLLVRGARGKLCVNDWKQMTGARFAELERQQRRNASRRSVPPGHFTVAQRKSDARPKADGSPPSYPKGKRGEGADGQAASGSRQNRARVFSTSAGSARPDGVLDAGKPLYSLREIENTPTTSTQGDQRDMNQQPSRDTSSKATKTRMLHDWSAIFNEAFWPVYPRKTHKQAAYRAWMRLGQLNLGATSGKLTPDDLIGNVLVMLDWFRVNEWKGRETQHIPNPATWINAEDFSDSRIAEVL